MTTKKLDFRVNLGVDPEFEDAINAARRSKRMTKTGFIRDTLLTELRKGGFLPAPKAKAIAR